MVGHEPAVARSHNVKTATRAEDRVHKPGQRLSLEDLGSGGRASGGFTEEDEVGDDEIVVTGERADLGVPLPGGKRTEAMDEEEDRLRVGFRDGEGFGEPAMEGGIGVDLDGSGAEAGEEEATAEDALDEGDHTEAHGLGRRSRGILKKKLKKNLWDLDIYRFSED